MDLKQIKYALAVEETLNFTRAAEKCGVSQPALTSGVKRLEESLGGQLFHREGRTTTLSQFGTTMLPKLGELLNKSDETLAVAEAFLKLDQTPLKLGVLVTIGPENVVPLLKSFSTSHPGVDVTIEEGTLQEICSKIDQNTIDAAIVSSSDLIRGNYHLEPLYMEKYVVALPRDHVLADKAKVTLRDLDKQDYIDRLSCEMRERIWSNCEGYKVDLYARYRTDREDWVRQMVDAGIGFAFLPEKSIGYSDLTIKPLVDPAIERTVHLMTAPGRRSASGLKGLLDHIRSNMRSEETSAKLSKGNRVNVKATAERLYNTVKEQGNIERLTQQHPDLTEVVAYNVQDALVSLHEKGGETVVGWKIGAANKRVMEQLGVTEPFYGRMLSGSTFQNGGKVEVRDFAHVCPELEICLQLGSDLSGPDVDADEARGAVVAAYASFEVTMPRYLNWNMSYVDAICANSGFAGYVLGQRIALSQNSDLKNLNAILLVDGVEAQTGVSRNALGDPFASLVAAANKLAKLGKSFKAGDLYLSGSLTPKLHITQPCTVEGQIEGIGAVQVDFIQGPTE